MARTMKWLRRGFAVSLVGGSLAAAGLGAQVALSSAAGAANPVGTGSITGSVHLASNPATPVSGICVGAEGPGGGQDFFYGGAMPITSGTGTYTISGLPAGTYFVTFYDGAPCQIAGGTPNYADNFYNGTPGGTLVGTGATTLPVTSGAASTANALMSPGGAITGTVTSASTSSPLAGVCVLATWNNGGSDEEYATTNGSGVYAITGLDPNVAYTVAVGPNDPCNVNPTYATQTHVFTTTDTATTGFNVTFNAAVTTTTPVTQAASYDLVGSDGGVFVFGQPGAGFYGSLPGLGVHVNNIKGIVPTATHHGYFLVGSDGGVFAFGDAPFENSLPGLGVHVNDIVGIVPTANDQGYFLVGADGGVFAFGNAPFENSLPGQGVHVNNIVGIVATANNAGYWLVSSTGTVYNFGNAASLGSVTNPTAAIVGITATTDGGGYWVVSANGTVYPFGDATGHGSLSNLGVSVSNIVSIVPSGDNGGYWLFGNDGGVFAFGDSSFGGSLPALGVHVSNIVGAVPVG